MVLMAELRKTLQKQGTDSWPLLPQFESSLEDFWHEPLGDIVLHVY